MSDDRQREGGFRLSSHRVLFSQPPRLRRTSSRFSTRFLAFDYIDSDYLPPKQSAERLSPKNRKISNFVDRRLLTTETLALQYTLLYSYHRAAHQQSRPTYATGTGLDFGRSGKVGKIIMTEEIQHEPTSDPPLTWREARYRLRSFLGDYASLTPPTEVKKRESIVAVHVPGTNWAYLQFFRFWLEWDLDVYIGAFGSSLAILVITWLTRNQNGLTTTSSETAESQNENNRINNGDYPRLQFTAGILVFLGSLINLWMIQRRRYSNNQGNDSLKRREISRFLKEIEKQEEERLTRQDGLDDDVNIQEHPLELDGTALAGVYPVYRRKFRYGGKPEAGSWCRIPTLLLVKGDHIALQVGDIAPAACKLIEVHKAPVRLEAGELITLETFQETSTLTAGKWPRGRTTLPKDSDKLLTLCNNMRIFEVLETPLEGFLKQPRGKYHYIRYWQA
jgi:hypothetical protein